MIQLVREVNKNNSNGRMTVCNGRKVPSYTIILPSESAAVMVKIESNQRSQENRK